MTDFVYLNLKRNRGYPWPQESWGLTPMFGEDGWCRSCGVPKSSQSGSLILQSKAKTFDGAWTPYWLYDAFCVDQILSKDIGARFDVDLREIHWHGKDAGQATQFLVPTTPSAWFDAKDLKDRTKAKHGTSGATCPACGVWRWLPLGHSELPAIRTDPFWKDRNIVASPEWFGNGQKSFREILFKRDLAELLVAASPRDFNLGEPNLIS